MEKQETSIGAVVINSKNEFLLLFQRKAQYWEFPKGHMEGQEGELVTMAREVKEETGIRNYDLIKDFRQETSYSFERNDEKINKTTIFYLIRTDDPIEICIEHEKHLWTDYETALRKVKYDSQRRVLKKAYEFISKLEK